MSSLQWEVWVRLFNGLPQLPTPDSQHERDASALRVPGSRAHLRTHTPWGLSLFRVPSCFGIWARSPGIRQGAGRWERPVSRSQEPAWRDVGVRRASRPAYSPGPLQLFQGAGAGPLARRLQGAVVLRSLPGEGDGQDSLSERVEATPTAAPTRGGPGAQKGGRRHLHAVKGIVLLQLLLPGVPGPVGQLRRSAGGERRRPGRL